MNNTLTLFREIARAMELSIGCTATAISYMKLYRYDQETIPMPETDTPYLYLGLDGSMRLYTPSGMMDYIAGQYSVSAVYTPNSAKVLTFSEQQDFLALSVAFTLEDVLSVMLDLEAEPQRRLQMDYCPRRTWRKLTNRFFYRFLNSYRS